MVSTRYEEIVERIKTLTLEQQMKLRGDLDDLLARKDQESKDAALAQRLLEKGIIRRIPPPIQDFTPYKNRRRITVQGKPLSETVIEER